jgi:hypothetical protein
MVDHEIAHVAVVDAVMSAELDTELGSGLDDLEDLLDDPVFAKLGEHARFRGAEIDLRRFVVGVKARRHHDRRQADQEQDRQGHGSSQDEFHARMIDRLGPKENTSQASGPESART